MRTSWLQRLVLLALSFVLCGPGGAAAQVASGDRIVTDAREALRRGDRPRLAALRTASVNESHPLAPWVDYWELSSRLAEAQQGELDAFYARWSGTYVEDRLRNDWLLELGRRRDWTNFTRDYPAFRMRDDREVACYHLLTEHLAGKDVTDAARAQWFAQRDADDGCHLLAQTLFEARRFVAPDVWRKLRLAAEQGRHRAARTAAALLGTSIATAVDDLIEQPARYLARRASAERREGAELAALALARLAAGDAEVAATQLDTAWQRRLPPDLAGWAWAVTARQTALALSPEAHARFQRALRASRRADADWSDELRAWQARAALRAEHAPQRWEAVQGAIDDMSDDARRDPVWIYWRARALMARADEHPADAETLSLQAAQALESIAGPFDFYGRLAAEDLRRPVALPPRPAEPSAAEREAARAHPGLTRALHLIALGLRNEGVREWNWSLRGMSDRELLAAAQWACEREVWDRCINTSDRTRAQVDVEQRYPTPLRAEIEGHARAIGLDPAYVYGLVRQESRFIVDARSSVGASGLMQVMPATARWTARKIGLPYNDRMITDRQTNLKLGTAYLKLVLDDFGGSQAMAAAAYNAGPSRPRRWREGPTLETAIWAENIPFSETRDYVKKVLVNASVYAQRLGTPPATLKARLGPGVGPRPPAEPASDEALP